MLDRAGERLGRWISRHLSGGRVCCVCERTTNCLNSPFPSCGLTPLCLNFLIFVCTCIISPLVWKMRKSWYRVQIFFSFLRRVSCLLYPSRRWMEGKFRSKRAFFTPSLFLFATALVSSFVSSHDNTIRFAPSQHQHTLWRFCRVKDSVFLSAQDDFCCLFLLVGLVYGSFDFSLSLLCLPPGKQNKNFLLFLQRIWWPERR